jgi:hypothetical protein
LSNGAHAVRSVHAPHGAAARDRRLRNSRNLLQSQRPGADGRRREHASGHDAAAERSAAAELFFRSHIADGRSHVQFASSHLRRLAAGHLRAVELAAAGWQYAGDAVVGQPWLCSTKRLELSAKLGANYRFAAKRRASERLNARGHQSAAKPRGEQRRLGVERQQSVGKPWGRRLDRVNDLAGRRLRLERRFGDWFRSQVEHVASREPCFVQPTGDQSIAQREFGRIGQRGESADRRRLEWRGKSISRRASRLGRDRRKDAECRCYRLHP